MQLDLEKHEEMWGLFEEFNTSMGEMVKEEWIIFRSKSYRFEEFLSQWYDRLQNSKQGLETCSNQIKLNLIQYNLGRPIVR